MTMAFASAIAWSRTTEGDDSLSLERLGDLPRRTPIADIVARATVCTEELGKPFATDLSYSSPRGSVRPVISRISFALSDSDFSKA